MELNILKICTSSSHLFGHYIWVFIKVFFHEANATVCYIFHYQWRSRLTETIQSIYHELFWRLRILKFIFIFVIFEIHNCFSPFLFQPTPYRFYRIEIRWRWWHEYNFSSINLNIFQYISVVMCFVIIHYKYLVL